MTYRGHIKNGQVTLDEPARLPEGAEVQISVVSASGGRSEPQRRMRRIHLDPDLARQIASGAEFHPDEL